MGESQDDTLSSQSLEIDESAQRLRLSRPHPLIKRTLDIKVEKDPYGYTRQPAWPGVDVRVSKTANRNALIVLDRLFKSLEKQGVQVSVIDGGYDASGTFAVLGRDKVQLYVAEENKKIPHEPTAKELRDKEKYPHSSRRIPKYDSVPTGVLTLVPGGVVDSSSEEALATLIAKATDDVMRQLEVESKQREAAQEKQQREWDKQKQDREEQERVEALHKAATAFSQYRDLMAYVEEVRRFGWVPDTRALPS